MKLASPLSVILALAVLGFAAATSKGDKKVDPRVYELRTYHVAAGRMEALQARFRDHTAKLLEKHGMKIIGFWNPTDGEQAESTLIYVLSFPTREAADQSWQSFRDDPEWKKVKEASERDGKIVEKVDSVFMKPTDYSPLK